MGEKSYNKCIRSLQLILARREKKGLKECPVSLPYADFNPNFLQPFLLDPTSTY